MSFNAAALAQRRGVVVDMETGIPIRDVRIYADNGREAVSQWDGTFVLDSCRSVTFSHGRYLARVMDMGEIGDTVRLIPKANELSEVVVVGRRKPKSIVPPMSKVDAQLINNSGMQGFNPLGLILGPILKSADKKKARKLEKARQILENY